MNEKREDEIERRKEGIKIERREGKRGREREGGREGGRERKRGLVWTHSRHFLFS